MRCRTRFNVRPTVERFEARNLLCGVSQGFAAAHEGAGASSLIHAEWFREPRAAIRHHQIFHFVRPIERQRLGNPQAIFDTFFVSSGPLIQPLTNFVVVSITNETGGPIFGASVSTYTDGPFPPTDGPFRIGPWARGRTIVFYTDFSRTSSLPFTLSPQFMLSPSNGSPQVALSYTYNNQRSTPFVNQLSPSMGHPYVLLPGFVIQG